MAQILCNTTSPLNDFFKKSMLVSPGPPALYRLNTKRTNLDTDRGKIRKWTFGQTIRKWTMSRYGQWTCGENKTILMVGETGTGKTTVINTMVNYFLGVKFEDKVWFEITEEGKRDQTESQTSEITAYEIFVKQRPFSLTIIDTPGYGDTRGIEKDTEIAQNLYKLFVHDTGVKSLDAVCLVLKSSQNRISEVQHYIFEAVLSLFGKDIEDIVVLFITHSDGGPPTNALEAVEKEKIPCRYDTDNEPVHFIFNNRQSEKCTTKYECVFKSAWEMGERSMDEFFEFLKTQQKKSLTLTISVLKERMQLEACVQSLKERIKFMEAKQRELTQVQEALEQNKKEIEKDGKFPFTIKVTYKEKVNITDVSWKNRKITSCNECEENCHEFGCWFASGAQWCEIMKNKHCTVCQCHYSKHTKEGKKYVIKEKVETVTFEELKNKYLASNQERTSYDENAFKSVETVHEIKLKVKKNKTNLETRLKSLLDDNERQKGRLVKDAYVAILKLTEIALKPDSAFTVQYLDFLIPRVEDAGEREWAQKLKSIQKDAAKESIKATVGYLRGNDYFFRK
ncbi:uncharacterized protein [Hoplias malabaricus]|uniref:uncharacterized protein n=1 Tax=Hoplias malabaricus TaxID=27720 RepID=UPI0034634B18